VHTYCRCSYDAAGIKLLVKERPPLLLDFKACKNSKSYDAGPSGETRPGCQTRIRAVASPVGELKGEDCACQIHQSHALS
jgi:hypothetical protein